jgi:hypothetical protein
MSAGFIKLSRNFFTNHLWNEARVYSKCEAWLDLIQRKEFGETEIYETEIAKRWSWSLIDVRKFLKSIEVDILIKRGGVSKSIKYLTKPTSIYFIQLDGHGYTYYKIGIAINNDKRFKCYLRIGFKITVLYTKIYESRNIALSIESTIKREFDSLKISSPFAFDGYTECFTDDILKTDIIKYFK